MDNLRGVIVDNMQKQLIFVKNDVLLNQLHRDSRAIEKSFDELCKDQLKPLSDLLGQTTGIALAGLMKTGAESDELRFLCGQILINGISTFVGAVQSLRSGYLLAPGIICRSVVETLAVISHLVIKPADLSEVKAGKFHSPKAVTTAKEVIPVFGKVYGYLSNQFAHVGPLYQSIQPLEAYKNFNDALRINFAFLKICLWMAYVVTELLFYDCVGTARYWKLLGNRQFKYAPDTKEQEWQQSFLGEAIENKTDSGT